MARSWPAAKDPDEVKDYTLDWAPLLVGGDTIATSVWSVVSEADGDEPALNVDSSSATTTVTTVWLSGGNIGNSELLNRVTTTGGRTYDQTMKLKIKTK